MTKFLFCQHLFIGYLNFGGSTCLALLSKRRVYLWQVFSITCELCWLYGYLHDPRLLTNLDAHTTHDLTYRNRKHSPLPLWFPWKQPMTSLLRSTLIPVVCCGRHHGIRVAVFRIWYNVSEFVVLDRLTV